MAGRRSGSRRTRPSLHAEDGQMIVTVALLSVFIFMIMAIAVEVGFTWMQKRNLQNAADAAALAGAQVLPGDLPQRPMMQRAMRRRTYLVWS
jgi:Flp pilus assembly protein TadG